MFCLPTILRITNATKCSNSRTSKCTSIHCDKRRTALESDTFSLKCMVDY